AVGILPIGDEFRKRIAFCAIQEKIWKRLAHHVTDDKFRWCNAWTNGSEPGAERVPNQLWKHDREIVQQALSDGTGLHEDMVSMDFAAGFVCVGKRRGTKGVV